jgi:hypothetical protein
MPERAGARLSVQGPGPVACSGHRPGPHGVTPAVGLLHEEHCMVAGVMLANFGRPQWHRKSYRPRYAHRGGCCSRDTTSAVV